MMIPIALEKNATLAVKTTTNLLSKEREMSASLDIFLSKTQEAHLLLMGQLALMTVVKTMLMIKIIAMILMMMITPMMMTQTK